MKPLRVLLALPFLLNAGCLKTVTMRTLIENDGSVERHIRIESHNAPNVDSDLRLPPKQGWQQYKKEEKLFETRGKFKSVADIPLDFEKTVTGPGDKLRKETSKSVKTYKAFRCALFTVHEYTETITDITSREQFDGAVEGLIKLRTLLYAIAEKRYGAEFDFTKAKAYVEKEVVPRVRRLAAQYWEARMIKRRGLARRFRKRGEAILGELGMKLPEDEDGGIDLGKGIDKWLPEKLAELVKPKRGPALTVEHVRERLEKMKDDAKLGAITKAEVKERFGGPEKFAEHAADVLLPIVGAYLQLLEHRFEFDASVLMPGKIARTNGTINDDEVSWSFTHEMIFPYYRMDVTSVAFSPANDRLATRPILRSTAHAVMLAEFVQEQDKDDQARLLKAIEKLAETAKPAALRQLAVGENPVGGLGKLLKRIDFPK